MAGSGVVTSLTASTDWERKWFLPPLWGSMTQEKYDSWTNSQNNLGFKSGFLIYWSSFTSQSLHFLTYKIRTIQPILQSCYYNQTKYIKVLFQTKF